MGFIPEDKLLEIKDAASIEEVVGQYVKLTSKGKNLSGLCPFHSETKPSFTVAPEKGIFYCFGCGAGGNVISFLMQYHRLSFPEAAQELARRYGIPLSVKDLGPEGAQQAKKRTKAYEANAAAAAFYAATLASSEGKPGREYLTKRGLTPEIIRAFQLGYAVDEWDALRRHFQNRGISLELAQEVGLLAPRDRGGFYDRFRNRIMFPIFDRQSRVIAFGGRIIGEGEPKYLNSPESPLYSKGRTLYGLPQAAEALRASGVALVVEGYLDLIALQVHGVGNVLATLGTALTREQVRLLKALADKVVLVYDGDAAGAKAMKRAFPLFAQENLAVRALPLPAGLDPDSYAQSRGVELFRTAWESAQPWFSYLLEDLDRHPRPGYRRPGAGPGGIAPLCAGPHGPGGTGPVAQGHQRAVGGGCRGAAPESHVPGPHLGRPAGRNSEQPGGQLEAVIRWSWPIWRPLPWRSLSGPVGVLDRELEASWT